MSRLRACTVEDFGLIARAEVRFADGLTAFTGETGSGKTMLVGALAFVLGDRAAQRANRQPSPRERGAGCLRRGAWRIGCGFAATLR